MIWGFLILNIILLLEIFISTYMISYCKKQEFDYSIFEIGLKSYLFVMIAGLITAIVNIFIFDFGFFRHLSSYGSKDVPPFAIYIVVVGFVIGIFTLLYTAIISAMPNSINRTDEVVLVEKGIKDIKVNGEDGYPLFANGGFKLIGKRGYAVNYFKGKPFFNQAFFNKNSLKGTIINVDNDVYSNLKSEKDPKKIKLKYYFYKKR